MKRWVCILLSLFSGSLQAHWSNPGYLELKQIAPESYSVVWKVPLRSGRPISISPTLPASCSSQTLASTFRTSTALVERWVTRCPGGLAGGTIGIKGLADTVNDVLVRINRLDDTVQTVRLKGTDSSFVVADAPDWVDVSMTYLILGVEHILSGIDHLLFVLALLIIVHGWRRLIATITAFTVAHSITLGAATLGWVHVPRPPVEAVIALSIVFLALEIARRGNSIRADGRNVEGAGVMSWQGDAGKYRSLAYEWPWLVAFSFGLLHGFGFAGALTEVGLPQNAIPLALLFFNIGVELGQLLFVGGFVLLTVFTKPARWINTNRIEVVAAYLIGAVATYWTMERTASFWS